MEEKWTGRRTEGQRDPNKPRQTSSHDWGSNKTFAYICKGINHISQSLFIMTLNT